ncbi:MAG: mono/diheme cytochrome c family protein [Myxococcota bacterium]|jgi:mono/diheme cytochrome c family protein
MLRYLSIMALVCVGCGDKDDDTGVDGGGDDTASDVGDTDTTDAVSYADVEPILESHCTSCHVEGGNAPFAFDGYEAASAKADRIVARAVDGGNSPMPPSGLVLSDAEADVLVNWADQGTPE